MIAAVPSRNALLAICLAVSVALAAWKVPECIEMLMG